MPDRMESQPTVCACDATRTGTSCAKTTHLLREMICNRGVKAEGAEQLVAEVKAAVVDAVTVVAVEEALKGNTFTELIVVALADVFDAGITGIRVDQWFGVYASAYDGNFETAIECDTIELGLAGTYRAFARHAKIKEVLDAVPAATWAYDHAECIGAWSLDGNPCVHLKSEGRIERVGEDSPSTSALWTACLAVGFLPEPNTRTPSTLPPDAPTHV